MKRLRNRLRALVLGRSVQPPSEQMNWEDMWADPAFRPAWRLNNAAPEVLPGLIEDGWITSDMTVLDIGCGDGQVTGWLAGQGFKSVHGIDVAPGAVQRARANYGHLSNADFAVQDVCKDRPPKTYDFLFDRGCFHVVPEQLLEAYAAYGQAASHPETRFLLVHMIHSKQGNTPESVVDKVRRTLEPAFTLTNIEEIKITTKDPNGKPGLAIQMLRRSR